MLRAYSSVGRALALQASGHRFESCCAHFFISKFHKFMLQRLKIIPEVHLILIKNNQTLLLLRQNTGYEDGKYSLVAGHPEGNEPLKEAMIREALEEAGITIKYEDLIFSQVMHRTSDSERVSFFFTTEIWNGEIKNMEPDKCSDLSWFSLDNLPVNIIPYIKEAINNHLIGIKYSEFGW